MARIRFFTDTQIFFPALWIALLLTLCATPACSGEEGQSPAPAPRIDFSAGPSTHSADATFSRQASAANPWITDFVFLPSIAGEIPGSSFVQRSTYHKDAYSLRAEMGSIREMGLFFPYCNHTNRGAKFSFQSEVSGNSLFFNFFTAISAGNAALGTKGIKAEQKTLLTGASTQAGLFSKKVTVQATVAKTESVAMSSVAQANSSPATGGIARFSTQIDPLAGKIVAETGLNLSMPESAKRYDSARGSGYEFRLKGKIGGFGYDAAYKRPITEYSMLRESQRRKDSVRYSLSSMVDLPSHSIAMTLSQDEMSTIGVATQKESRVFEGVLSYSYKGFARFPLGIEYRQQLRTTRSENVQGIAGRVEEDTFSGSIGYRHGIHDWGFQGRLKQKIDPVSKQTEQVESLLSFSPHMIFTDMAVLPCLSARNSKHLITGDLTDTYAFTLGTKGKTHVGRIQYEVYGEFSNSFIKSLNETRKNIKSNLKISMPLAQKEISFSPFLVFKSRYNSQIRRPGSKDEFSILLAIEKG
ncbi:MAG: hypothetical protein EG822_05135 [Deltaproteobacteria bacterium]|nr:hypothetical protein [Deltaproteobacteria bacterium]TLN04419.1 MAG: hypothetical protein FDZ73_03805 [bacterium]